MINGISDFKTTEITMFPMGRNNDFLRSFPQQKTEFQDIWELINGRAVPVDVMHINDSTYALNHICLGNDKATVRRTSKRILPFIDSIIPALQDFSFFCRHTLWQHKHEYIVEIDGKSMDVGCNLALIINGTSYERKFFCKQNSNIRDGTAHGIFINNTNTLRIIRSLYSYDSKNLESNTSSITQKSGQQFSIRRKDEASMLLNIDGEIMTVEELNIKIIPMAINFVVPKSIGGER